ncbi:MAG: metallopeptidase family protein [Myxococcota bacterium]|nr:metallopeptidase family protein [Myxococcota bacterium]
MEEKDRYWDCLDRAVEATHGGRTEEALAWYEEALKANPGGAEAHNGRGELLWEEGRIEEALYEVELATQADPKFVTAHLNRAELLIEELGEQEQAVQYCDSLLSGGPELPRPDRGTEAEIHYLKSKAYFYLDDLEGALFLVRRALKTGGDVPVYRAFEGQLCFELGRFEEARRHLEQAVILDPESPHALYHLGLTLERLGEDEDAARAFHQANALHAEQYPLPVTLDRTEFERIAAEALADLPRSIREYVENVPVLIEDFPGTDLLGGENVSPQILGLFQGVPRTEAAVTAQAQDVDRVLLFKKNLEKVCRNHAELTEQIQITVKHEIGHYLGLDEDDLERLGLA